MVRDGNMTALPISAASATDLAFDANDDIVVVVTTLKHVPTLLPGRLTEWRYGVCCVCVRACVFFHFNSTLFQSAVEYFEPLVTSFDRASGVVLNRIRFPVPLDAVDGSGMSIVRIAHVVEAQTTIEHCNRGFAF
jgi:hypothetical protein